MLAGHTGSKMQNVQNSVPPPLFHKSPWAAPVSLHRLLVMESFFGSYGFLVAFLLLMLLAATANYKSVLHALNLTWEVGALDGSKPEKVCMDG